MKTATIYKYYSDNGEHLHFVKLNDEIMDEYTIAAADGFEIRDDVYGIPYTEETETHIHYDVRYATLRANGSITAPALKVNAMGRIVTGKGQRTIARVI